jgi:site-specific DNA recombinase
MTTAARLRCAVYTRKSSEEGLEQDFNSLHAQREACEAYIASQRHEGWSLVTTAYDDGGYSGGSMERPGLKALLDDIADRRIDVVVVYKVDRLTRSLSDFARMVEVFDRHGISFVSVTQSFNTTTSMGRLTLNVLLSFAQFERKVTAERIRDKIAASKKKGLWMGGTVPLGYRVKDRKLVIVPDEAETVRTIYRRYLELRTLDKLLRDLRRRKIVTKVTILANGQRRGGIPFAKGSLGYLLGNRTYLGEIKHHSRSHKGDHEPILDRALFDDVQSLRVEHAHRHRHAREQTQGLLGGRLFDEAGRRYAPVTQKKGAARYRYYVLADADGKPPSPRDAPHRVSGLKLDNLVLVLLERALPAAAAIADPLERVRQHVGAVKIGRGQVTIHLAADEHPGDGHRTLTEPWSPGPYRVKREVLPAALPFTRSRPIRAETRETLLTRIAQGRQWLEQLADGHASSIEDLAAREEVTPRFLLVTISLAFLAPSLIEAAIEGTLPDGIGVAQLRDPAPVWDRQLRALGLQSAAAGTAALEEIGA